MRLNPISLKGIVETKRKKKGIFIDQKNNICEEFFIY